MCKDDDRTVWVLDTETKGTGAEMVPLEKLKQRRRTAGTAKRTTVLRRTRSDEPSPAPPTPESRAPRRFRVVGVMSGAVIVDDVGSRGAVDALRPFQSPLDVRIYVWEPDDEDWRLLTLGEKKAMWAFRDDRR